MRTSSITQKAQAQLGIKKLRKHQIKPIQSILDETGNGPWLSNPRWH